MNEKIKEILDIERYRNKDGYVENISLMPDEIHKLLDYITNLQKEIEKLNNIINNFEKWLEEYISLLKEPDIYEEQTLEDLKEVLDKLRELKGDSSNE